MDWYYADDDSNRIGPLSDEQFRGLIKGGTITDETLVWHEGMADWEPYAATIPEIPAIPSVAHHPIPAIPPQARPLITADSGKTIAKYGGFWIRFVAKMIDGFLVAVVQGIFQLPAMITYANPDEATQTLSLLGSIASFAVPAAYATWFIGRFGATPGKMTFGLKVVRADGTSVSYGRAFARYVSEIRSGLILLIGYIMAAFDAEKRTLHDHLCDTRVIVSRR